MLEKDPVKTLNEVPSGFRNDWGCLFALQAMIIAPVGRLTLTVWGDRIGRYLHKLDRYGVKRDYPVCSESCVE
jgi:hypothetical protein